MIRLIHQAALHVELLQPSLDDLILDRRRLPLQVGLCAQDLSLALQNGGGHFVPGEVGRLGRADL